MSFLYISEMTTVMVELVMATVTVFYVARSHYSGLWRYEKSLIILACIGTIVTEALWVSNGPTDTSILFHIATNLSSICWMLGISMVSRRESHDLMKVADRMTEMAKLLETVLERHK